MNDRDMLRTVTKALEDLSFECFGGIGTTRPSIETYNRTFGVLETARNYVAVTEPVVRTPMVYPPKEQGPCTVCGTPWAKHGSYPTCCDHEYAPTSGVRTPDGSQHG